MIFFLVGLVIVAALYWVIAEVFQYIAERLTKKQRYFVILAICISVFFASQFVPQADYEWFYVIQSMWAFGILTAVLAIERLRA